MNINEAVLDLVFRGFQAKYTTAYLAAPTHGDKIAMTVPSSSREETYGWLGAFPNMREWIGPRHVKSLEAHGFTIKNRKFESTVEVNRDDIADDKIGVYGPAFSEMGQAAKRHPEELIFGLLASGFDAMSYDGQNFFDTDHPVKDENDNEVTVSNMQAGTVPAWYLLDTSRGVRPIIWQERERYEFTQITRADDHHVFMNDKFVYGIRARVNAGFGLWQLAFGSKATLNAANYSLARASMMRFTADGGRKLGVSPTVMVVPPELESAALALLNTEFGTNGESNIWKGTAQLIVTPYL
ncbi:MAG: Mu-like prophage major head subunit gpT family protein [Paracoccaceae bacterium]